MIVDSFEIDGYRIEVTSDEYADNPREWCDISRFVLAHKRYNMPNESSIDPNDYDTLDGLQQAIEEEYGTCVFVPVSMYDHGNVHIYAGSPTCPWDSGYLGVAFMTRDDVIGNWGGKYLTKRLRQRAIDFLKAEIELYGDYMSGHVFSASVYDPDGEVLDSCHGFYGLDYSKSGLLEFARETVANMARVTA